MMESVPEQSPDHPENVDVESGSATRVTGVSLAYSSSQSLPQLIPAGLLVIVPEPFPARFTEAPTNEVQAKRQPKEQIKRKNVFFMYYLISDRATAFKTNYLAFFMEFLCANISCFTVGSFI
jgi:hypothetical protein